MGLSVGASQNVHYAGNSIVDDLSFSNGDKGKVVVSDDGIFVQFKDPENPEYWETHYYKVVTDPTNPYNKNEIVEYDPKTGQTFNPQFPTAEFVKNAQGNFDASRPHVYASSYREDGLDLKISTEVGGDTLGEFNLSVDTNGKINVKVYTGASRKADGVLFGLDYDANTQDTVSMTYDPRHAQGTDGFSVTGSHRYYESGSLWDADNTVEFTDDQFRKV